MSEDKEVKQAVETIREYCARHDQCDVRCRLFPICAYQRRKPAYVPPEYWPEIAQE